MCLYLKHYTPKYTTKDKVVYKWLLSNPDGVIFSPFKMFMYEYNKVYTSLLLRSISYSTLPYDIRHKKGSTLICVPQQAFRLNKICANGLVPATAYLEDVVEVGFHTFDSIGAAIVYKNHHFGLPQAALLYKCIIPKHSWYYEGNDGELASDHLVIKDLLDSEYKVIVVNLNN